MRNFVPSLLLAAASACALAGCSNADRPSGNDFATHPAAGPTAAAAGPDSAAGPRPTLNEQYKNANQQVDRNHDGKAD